MAPQCCAGCSWPRRQAGIGRYGPCGQNPGTGLGCDGCPSLTVAEGLAEELLAPLVIGGYDVHIWSIESKKYLAGQEGTARRRIEAALHSDRIRGAQPVIMGIRQTQPDNARSPGDRIVAGHRVILLLARACPRWD